MVFKKDLIKLKYKIQKTQFAKTLKAKKSECL